MNPTSSFDAVLFDLDGVLTSTAALHAAAWKRTFDPLLTLWGQEPFDLERDYLDHVDGKPRADGVRDYLLESRGVTVDDAWSGLRFRLQIRGQLVEVDMRPTGTTYRLLEGRGLPIRHFGEALRLTPDSPLHRPANPAHQLRRAA